MIPYYARFAENIKRILLDGYPLMCRLHPGTEYEVGAENLHRVDIEGHAVLITGYDDDRQAFVIQDPWNKKFGAGFHGTRHIPYWEFCYRIVNSSLGGVEVIAPPVVSVMTEGTPKAGEIIAVKATVGMYSPDMNLMDTDSSWLEQISLLMEANEGIEIVEGSESQIRNDRFPHGKTAEFIWRVQVLNEQAETLKLTSSAVYAANRPYPFRGILRCSVAIELVENNRHAQVFHLAV